MRRPLDFVVLGVPRSGTTAIARALNAHPKVLCGIERFLPDFDHSQIIFPDSFTNKKIEAMERNVERTIEALNSKGVNLSIIGNKTPRYYINLPNVLKNVKDGRVVYCYRHIADVIKSWNSLESGGGRGWQSGRVGVFSVAELAVCLAALAMQRDAQILISSYSAFKSDSRRAMALVLPYLSPTLGVDFDEEMFQAAEEVGRQHMSRPKPPLNDIEREALALIRADEIDAVLDLPAPGAFDNVRAEILTYLAALPASLIDQTMKLTTKYERPEVVEFGEKQWRRRVERLWADLHPRIRSEIGAGRPFA